MQEGISLLITTAAGIGFLHTLLGPDHYLPFIVMARARNWSTVKTMWVTAACGLGHVSSSVLLGMIGVLTGIGLNSLVNLESVRGNIAAWMLIGFGFAYMVWGIRRAVRNKPHAHAHAHADGSVHSHMHQHDTEHAHLHKKPGSKNITPWVLFLIFVLGPCEPLIPILIYPAAENNLAGVVAVSVVFSLVTILTMMGAVLAGLTGVSFVPFGKLEKYMHAMAGGIIFLSGIGIRFLGL